jgi:hypothetical protein|tara:strand:- start:5471 stop:9382 length:3912 start_codon:yes stop_codon:yes gene_type:complete
MARIVSYKFRETDQAVYISGSGGTSASIAADVAAIKLPNASFNANYNLRVVGLNNFISYVTGEGMTIPVSSSEELWVYRGYQPFGSGDNNAYNYNPYFHRPYKLYSVVSTQSGVPSNPWLPSGSVQFSGTGPSSNFGQLGALGGGLGYSTTTTNQFFQTQFDMIEAGVLAEVGNPTTQSYTTESISGSFEIFHPERNVSPYVWTRYIGGAYNPPAFGAQFVIRAQSGPDSGSNYSLDQQQGAITNMAPFKLDSVNLARGVYSYTSSNFDNTGVNNAAAYGSTVFGLFCNYGNYVQYRAFNNASSTADLRITYTASNLTSSFFDVGPGLQADFDALVGTVSQSQFNAGTLTGDSTFSVDSVQASGVTVPDYFAYKIDKVYASYSSSLSSSLDGLYVFNQVPQTNIMLTASIRVDAWTGSDPSAGAVYGVSSSLYGTASYGAGELGDGDTWPTCSIKIFKGNFPLYVPAVDITGSLIGSISQSILTESVFHVNQGTATQHTMSYLMTESIYYRDCLNMAITVSSGSAASSSVQNALFVKDYYMEFKNEPLIEGDGLVPTNLEGAFSGSLPFAFAKDCQPILNNINRDRDSSNFFDVDYTYGIYTPINFDQIISGTAELADVQDSNYTTTRVIQPRYVGSNSTAYSLNSIDGLQGGYGLPVIDYLTSFFGYANEVTDPYPLINGVTQANIKYLVDGTGKAIQPNLSDWGAFDLQSTYAVSDSSTINNAGAITYENKARIAVNPQESQTQYLALNGVQSLYKVAQRVEPVLYSQTSSAGYATAIPLGGFAGIVSNYSASFTNYALTAGGNAWGGDRMDKTFNRAPLAASQSYVFSDTPSSGLQVLITGSSANIGSGAVGAIFFETDPRAPTQPPNSLSDAYQIELSYIQPSTAPKRRLTKAGSFWKKSSYDNEVGYIEVKLQKDDNENFSSPTFEPIQLASQVYVKMWFGLQSDGDYIVVPATTLFGYGNVSVTSARVRITIDVSNISTVVTNQGRNYDDCTFVEFGFLLRTYENLFSNTYYRWSTECFYEAETVSSTKNNFWNPTHEASPIASNPAITPSVFPTTTIRVFGTQTGQTSQDNALNVPYWAFPTTDITGVDVQPNIPLNQIELLSQNGNDLYGNSIQRTLAYSASVSAYFPGNQEPIDTTWPQQRLAWSVEPGDEIRFENNESETYKIIAVTSPEDNEALTSQGGTGQYRLKLTVDRNITPSVNKDFFMIRRYVDDASTIIIQNEFPYPGTRGNANEYNKDLQISGSTVGGYQAIPPEPLSKKQLTTSAIVFPVFPTNDINTQPDLLLDALRNNKLID